MLQCSACGECFKDIYELSNHRRYVHGVNYHSVIGGHMAAP